MSSDLKSWLEAHGCGYEPVEGTNHTGVSLKIINKTNGRYSFMRGPFDGPELADRTIRDLCEQLFIPVPGEV